MARVPLFSCNMRVVHPAPLENRVMRMVRRITDQTFKSEPSGPKWTPNPLFFVGEDQAYWQQYPVARNRQ